MADLHPVKIRNAAAAAKLLPKFQRYFWRKPLRFLTFVALYLTAGSLVILHAGFRGEPRVPEATPRDSVGTVEETGSQALGKLQFSREFKTRPESLGPRYGSWFKTPSKDASRGTNDGETWVRVIKGRSSHKEERARYIGCFKDNTRQRTLRGVSFFDYKKMTLFRCQNNCAERGYLFAGLEFGVECYCGHQIQAAKVNDAECYMACSGENSSICGGANRLSIFRLKLTQESASRRHGSAFFRGCFRRPENLSVAFLTTKRMKNISVDQCVDFCTGKEYPLAALNGTTCHCGFPTTLFSLRKQEGDQLCAQKCSGEEFDSCGTSDYFVVYQTQVQDNRCMDRRFRTAPPKELVALASFPGAGNTWARHLIELATGFYTGSYYFDGSLYNKGFKGEQENWHSGRTICIKTHESGQKEIEAFDSAILLIRNPYKALMAEFNRKYGGHIGFASYAHWAGKDWPEFVQSYAPWWAAHTLDWLNYRKKVLVVHFEDLKRDLFVQLKRMVSFLGVGVQEDRLLCVEGQKDGNFKRSGLRKLEYDPYTPKMRTMINSYIKMVDTALKHRNLTGVPEEYYPR